MIAAIEAGASFDPPAGAHVEGMLHRAAEAEDVALARELVKRGADVNRASHYGTTPLMTAASKGNRELVELLLDAGADPRITSRSGTHVVHEAVRHPALLELLAARGARFDDRVESPLISAARGGHLESVKFLLARGAQVDVRESYGGTPLTEAIEHEHTEVALALIAAGASPSFVSRRNGESPVTGAANKGDVEVLRALIAKGAELDAKNEAGESAIEIIVRRKATRTAFAELLAARGIDVSVPKLEPLDRALATCSPVWSAVYRGATEEIRVAMSSGALAVDARDPWGVTPLMCAMLRRNGELVRVLLEKGAAVELEDHAGAQAFDYVGFSRDEELDGLLEGRAGKRLQSMDRMNAQAARALLAGEVEQAMQRGEIAKIAKLVREKKVHPFLGVNGEPLLIQAMGADDEDLLGALFELGLSPEVSDGDGRTPIAIALGNGNRELAAKLVEAGARVDAPGLLAQVIDRGEEESVAWLLERGANTSGALHAAAARGMVAIMEKLIELGADVGAFNASGKSPLHYAIESYEESAARFLIEKGASWDAVAPGVEDAQSARAFAEDRGMGEDWPS